MPDPKEQLTPSTKPSILKRWLGWRSLALTAFALILLAPVPYRGSRLAQVPVINEPYDVAEFLKEIPKDENSYFDFEQAGRELKQIPDKEYAQYSDELDAGWGFDTRILNNHLENNRLALDTWLKGTAKDRYQSPARLPADGHPRIAVEEMEEFNRLASIQIQKLVRTNRPAEAVPWLRAQFRFAHLVRQKGVFANYSVGVACFDLAADTVNEWSTHPELSATEIAKAYETLESARRLNPPLSETRKALYPVERRFFGNQSIEGFIQLYRSSGLEPPPGAKWKWWLDGEPEYTLRLFPHLTRNHLLFIDKPRRKRPPLIDGDLFDDSSISPVKQEELNADEMSNLMAQSALFHVIFGGLPVILNTADRDEARYRCLTVALAAQAYFRDRGEFPEKAAELVPEYLDEIPDDLYSPTPAPLLYCRDGNGAVIYSRFTNEIDDGGTAVDYNENIVGGDLPDLGFHIRKPFNTPLTAPKP